MNKDLLKKTFRNVALATVYIFGVSQIMYYGEEWLGNLGNTNFGPFAMLLLFSVSAAVVGSLVFGQSVFLFIDGKKKESMLAGAYSVGWLVAFTAITLLILAIVK